MSFLNNIKISTKLIVSFLIILILIAILSYFSIEGLAKLNGVSQEIIIDPLPGMYHMSDMNSNITEYRLKEYALILLSTKEELEEKEKEMTDILKKIKSHQEGYEKTITTEEDRKLYDKFKILFNNYMSDGEKLKMLAEENKDKEASEFILGNYRKRYEDLSDSLDALVAFNQNRGEKLSKIAEETYISVFRQILIIISISILFAIILIVITTRSITKPIKNAIEFATDISNGNFSFKINALGKNETAMMLNAMKRVMTNISGLIGEVNTVVDNMKNKNLSLNIEKSYEGEYGILKNSINEIVETMNDIISQVSISIEQFTSGSDQISATAQSLSHGASEQASAMEEISNSLTEMTDQSKQNLDKLNQVNILAKQSVSSGEEGNKRVSELLQTMDKINQSSENIKRITKLIDDISFQINLLALNASVEAARAGKYGKGFAVVAEEVRNLAVRSAESVKETSQMIEESGRNIIIVNKQVEEVAKQFKDISEGSIASSTLLNEMTIAITNQTHGISEINKGLTQIGGVTQSNTANAEESAAAAEELASQSGQLNNLVRSYKLKERQQKLLGVGELSPELIKKIEEEIKKRTLEHNSSKNYSDSNIKQLNKAIPSKIISLDEKEFESF